MYIDFIANGADLEEYFSDYIAYLLLSRQLLDDSRSYGEGLLLGATKGLQEAGVALSTAIKLNYPTEFCIYISAAADRIIQRTPDAERFFVNKLNRKLVSSKRFHLAVK